MNFQGYIVPGAIFFAFGLKWSLDISGKDRLKSNKTTQLSKHSSWRSSSSRSHKLRSSGCKNRFQDWIFEGLLKLTVACVGIAISVTVAYTNGTSHFINYILNSTVYLFFGLSGLVDILLHHRPGSLPQGADKFLLFFAFTMEGLMIYLHLSHQSFMEQHVHILLTLSIFACAIATLVEAILPSLELPKFARTLFTLIQGSWYVQCGFILHNPIESEPSTWTTSVDYNNALTQISLTFASHCAGAIVLLLLIFFVSNGGEKRRAWKSNHLENSDECTSSPDESTNNSNISNRCPLCSGEIGVT